MDTVVLKCGQELYQLTVLPLPVEYVVLCLGSRTYAAYIGVSSRALFLPVPCVTGHLQAQT